MIGSTRSRRLGALLAGAFLVITIAGCTVGTTTIPEGQSWQLNACTADGPTPEGEWVPGPGAQSLRVEVTSSDATQPLRAQAVGGAFTGNGAVADFGIVWDGTKSTGPKQVDLRDLQGYREFVLVLRIDTWGGIASEPIHVDWMLTALDANGTDVGFTCTF